MNEQSIANNRLIKDEVMNFNNWNDLMPVVEKIEAMGYIVSITKDMCQIGLPTDDEPSVSTRSSTKLQATYSAIVKYIERWKS